MSDASPVKIGKVVVDRDLCIGAAPCVTVSPATFELDEENKAVVKEGWRDVPADEIILAAQACPVAAIRVYDITGRRIYPEPEPGEEPEVISLDGM